MASALNGGGGNGGGGVGGAMKNMSLLRFQYYCVLGAVAGAVIFATLRYMPAAAAGAGTGALSTSSAVATAAAPAVSEHRKSKGAVVQPRKAAAVKGEAKAAEVLVFNFGDSNSDTGGAVAIMGIRIAPPEGRAFFGHPTGRLSDGRVVLDFICETLNTHHLSPYMKPLGSDYSNGVNFAIAGATATPGDTPFSLDVQVDQFIFYRERCNDSITRGESAPVDPKDFHKALFTLDIGQNDITSIMYLPYDQVLAKLPHFVAEIRRAIQTLHKNGARKFWVHGTGALGCLPAKLAIPRDNDGGLDEHGCLTKFNNAAKKFNELLSEACDDLRWQLKKSSVVFVDMFAIKYDLVANHTKHGIEKPLMTCCGHGGPPYNYDPKRSCMGVDKDTCKPDDKLISWDGVHFTDAANSLVASMAISGEYSIPRMKLTSLIKPAKSTDS
ncbi:hypothetical protein QYE76_009931 [Lolium multiflorum]|uniref:GDSL esterase/lipase n=1 Tax=Lolium multiflorum TaxID=4521 RepID=A0AAD8TW88_LOLMU|nr:hypothetical protein QYE76_009931 [Lolium multiflorum]